MSAIEDKSSPFKVALLVFKYAGIFNKENRPWSLIFTKANTLVTICVTILSCVDMIWGNEEMPEFVSALSAFLISIHINGKLFNFIYRETEIGHFIERMEKLRQKILQENCGKQIVLRADRVSIKMAKYYALFVLCCPTLSVASSIIINNVIGNRKAQPFFQIWLPWDITDIRINIATNILVIFCVTPSVLVHLTFATFSFIFTIEMSSFLQVLQSKLETLRLNDKMVYRLHAEIIQLVEDYNNLFSLQIYMEICLSSVQPCGFGYTLIKAFKTHDIRMVDFIYKFLLTIVVPFIICTCGQEVNTQLEKLHSSCYMCDWFEEKPASRRYLLQLMMSTVRPHAIGFRRMITFDYVCFTSVLQGIYSFLTLVNQFGE
ncbi:odorant receptor 47a-like isoform X2 [Rhodnius prolixus]|uniref:odorant receptor 47a-like isoform X2 n=1 Tax=Rhodnius prolixus TaxID=13249 RepID=UPI003D18C7F2